MLSSITSRLSILQFLQFFVWGSWFVTAGTYMMQTLGFTGREVGLIYANNALAASISPLLLGVIADKYLSVEKLLTGLHLIGAVLLFMMSQIQTFEMFYIINLLYVLCFLPTFSLTNSMSFHHVEDAKRDFPKVRVWGTISWICAGLIVGYLGVEAESTPFLIASGLSVLLAFYCLTLPKTPPSEGGGSSFYKDLFSPEMKVLFKDRGFLVIIISLALISVPAAYYYSFVNPFLNEMGVENAAGKMSLGQITEIVFMLTLPWFIAKWRLKYLIGLGLFLWGARYGLFIIGAERHQEWLYIVGLASHGIAYIFGMFTAQIYIDIKVPDYLRSTAQGFFSFLTLGIMAFVGTYIAGETVSIYTNVDGTHDWSKIWLLPFYFGVGTAIFFLIFFKNSAKK